MKYLLSFILTTLAVLTCVSCMGPEKNEFSMPDKMHFPQTWFHFIGNNVSIEGITADLEAISEAGISGVQFFHGQRGGAKWPGVDEGIAPLSENWDAAVKHIAQECDQYLVQPPDL